MTYALATIEDFSLRLGALEVSDIENLLYSCLVSATVQLSVKLKNKDFSAVVSKVDEFSLDYHTAFRDDRYLSFTLNNGFIDSTTNAVSLVYGTTPDELDNATPVASKFLRIDEEKGLVILDLWGLQEAMPTAYRKLKPSSFYQYLFRITYDSGFASKSTSAGKEYTGVPAWLKELALLKAREIYFLTNPLTSTDSQPKDSSINMSCLLDSHVRFFALSLTPII